MRIMSTGGCTAWLFFGLDLGMCCEVALALTGLGGTAGCQDYRSVRKQCAQLVGALRSNYIVRSLRGSAGRRATNRLPVTVLESLRPLARACCRLAQLISGFAQMLFDFLAH